MSDQTNYNKTFFPDILSIRAEAQQQIYNMFMDPSIMPASAWQKGGQIARWNQDELFEGVHRFADRTERIYTKDNAELYSKLGKSKQLQEQQEQMMNTAYSMVGSKYLEEFYAEYLEADSKYRIGEVVGTKPDPEPGELDPIHTPYTDALGHYFTIASFTDRFDASNDVADTDFYVNYLFAPYRLSDWSELVDQSDENYSKIKDWYTANSAQDLTTGFNSRGQFTYRAPSYKSLNDSIMHIQWLFEKMTGIVSTYTPEWDLSVYIQEGLISNSGGLQPEYISLLHRIELDTPEAGASDQTAYYYTNYGVVNAAVSILHKSNYETWDPTLNKYSRYWTPYPTTEEARSTAASLRANATGDYDASLGSFWARDDGYDGYNTSEITEGGICYSEGEKKIKDGWSRYRFPFWFDVAYYANESTKDPDTGKINWLGNSFSGHSFYYNQFIQDMENFALSDYTSNKLCYYNAFYLTGHDVTNANENFLTEAQTGAWLKEDIYNSHLDSNLGVTFTSSRKTLNGLTNINAHDPGMANTTYNSTGVNNSGIGTFSGSAGKFGLTPFGVVRAILEFLNSVFRKKSAATRSANNAVSSFGSSGLGATLGITNASAADNLGSATFFDETEETSSSTHTTGITGSLTDNLKELATTVGIPIQNPAIMGGPHGQSLAPTSLVSSAQTNNRFLRSVPRFNPETYISESSSDMYYKYWNVRQALDRSPTYNTWRPYHYDGPEVYFKVPGQWSPFGKSYSDLVQLQSGHKHNERNVTWQRGSWVANFVADNSNRYVWTTYYGGNAIAERWDGAFKVCGNYNWLVKQNGKDENGVTITTPYSIGWRRWRWQWYFPTCGAHYVRLHALTHTKVHKYSRNIIPLMLEIKYISSYWYAGSQSYDVIVGYYINRRGCGRLSHQSKQPVYKKYWRGRLNRSILGYSWTPSVGWNKFDLHWHYVPLYAYGEGWKYGAKQYQVSEKWWHIFYTNTWEELQITWPDMKWEMFDHPEGLRFVPYSNDWFYNGGGMWYGGWLRMHTWSEWRLYCLLDKPVTVDLGIIANWNGDMNSIQNAMASNVTLYRHTFWIRIYWWHRYRHKRHHDSDWHYYITSDWMIKANFNLNQVVPVARENQIYTANNLATTYTNIEDGNGNTVKVIGPYVADNDARNSFYQIAMCDDEGNVKDSMKQYSMHVGSPYSSWVYNNYHSWLPHGINMTSGNRWWGQNLWWCQTGYKGRGIFTTANIHFEYNHIRYQDSSTYTYMRRYFRNDWWETWTYPRMVTWCVDKDYNNTSKFLFLYLTQAIFYPSDTNPDWLTFVSMSVACKLAYLQAVYTIKATMKNRDFFLNMLDHFDVKEFTDYMQAYIPPKERFYAGDPTLELTRKAIEEGHEQQLISSAGTGGWHTSKMYGYNYWLDYAVGLFYYYNIEGKHEMSTMNDLKQKLKNAFNDVIKQLYRVVDAVGPETYINVLRNKWEPYPVYRHRDIPVYSYHWVEHQYWHVYGQKSWNYWLSRWAGLAKFGWMWRDAAIDAEGGHHMYPYQWIWIYYDNRWHHIWIGSESPGRTWNVWTDFHDSPGIWNSHIEWWRKYWTYDRYIAYWRRQYWTEWHWRQVWWWEKVKLANEWLKNSLSIPCMENDHGRWYWHDYRQTSWRRFHNVISDVINNLVHGSSANIINNFVYAYLNSLYEGRKTLIEYRMNKQDGTYWTMRQLEKAIPNIMNSLNVVTPGNKSIKQLTKDGIYNVDFYDVSNTYTQKMQALLDNKDMDEDRITYVYVPVEPATRADYEYDLKRRTKLGYASVALVAEWKWKRDENDRFVTNDAGERIKQFTGTFKYVKLPQDGEYKLVSDELTNELDNEAYNKEAAKKTPPASPKVVDPDRIFLVHWPINWGVPEWDNPGMLSTNKTTADLAKLELGETPIIFDVTSSLNLKNLILLKQNGLNSVKDLLCGARDTKDYWKVRVDGTLPMAIGYKNNVKLVAYNANVAAEDDYIDLTFGNATGMLYPITEETSTDQLMPLSEANLLKGT